MEPDGALTMMVRGDWGDFSYEQVKGQARRALVLLGIFATRFKLLRPPADVELWWGESSQLKLFSCPSGNVSLEGCKLEL